MAYLLLPGVMQDHRGQYFQYGCYPSGKCIMVSAELPELSTRIQEQLKHVLVESQSRLPFEGINEKAIRRLASGELYHEGETYETVRCIHESTI